MNQSNITIITDNHLYLITDKIKFEITSSQDISEFNYIKFRLYKIDKNTEYNYCIANLTTDLKENENGIYEFIIDSKIINLGIFFIGVIELLKQNNWNDPYPLKFKSYESEQIKCNYFKVQDDINTNYSYQYLLKEIEEIYQVKNSEFISGIGDKNLVSYFSTYVFIKNIYLTKRFTYGNFEIIPFSKFSSSNDVEYLNKFIEKEIQITERIEYDLNEKIPYENPGLVIFYPKIFALDLESAYTIAIKESNDLIKSFSLTRETKGDILSTILIDYDKRSLFYTKPEQFISNNIIHGEDFGENPILNKGVKELIKINKLFELTTTLYYDSVNENHIEIKYSKLWTVLEILAENKKYSSKILKKTFLNGEKINHNKNTINNNPTIKDKVRELLRENLNLNKFLFNILNPKNLEIEKIDDLITIWYRHRNCMVHSGGCQPLNESVCKIKSPDYKLCNLKHYEILKNHLERDIINDIYLIKLQETARCLIFNYYLSQTNDTDNISELIFQKMTQVPTLKFEEIKISSFGELEKIKKGCL